MRIFALAVFALFAAIVAQPAEAVDFDLDGVDIDLDEFETYQSQAAPGDTISVQWEGAVEDGETGGPWTVGIYLSQDGVITTDDVLLYQYTEQDDLGPFNFFRESAEVTIPEGTANGNYTIGAIADDTNRVNETNENNNVRSVSLQIGSSAPPEDVDIEIEEVGVADETIQAGGVTSVSWIGNVEDGPSGSFTIGIYLSQDDSITASDTVLGRISYIPENDVLDVFESSLQVTIPAGTSPGTYSVGVFLDDTNSVDEMNEGNNILTDNIQVTAGSAAPGQIQFVQSSYTVNETVGIATVRVERVFGKDGEVSVDYATRGASATASDDYQESAGILTWPHGVSGVRTFEVLIYDDSGVEGTETVQLTLSDLEGGVRLGSPSSATLRIKDDDQASGPDTECTPSSTVMCIDDVPGDRRFAVTISYDTVLGGGQAGLATYPDLSCAGVSKGGLFSFFNPENPEALVKVLNGCALNGYYWVFAAATTNVGFELTVRDTVTGAIRSWTNTDQTVVNPLVDTEVFSCGD